MKDIYMGKLRLQLEKLADRYSDLLDELEAVKESTELICDDMSDVVTDLYENLMLLDDPFIASLMPTTEEPCCSPVKIYAAESGG